MSKPKIKQIKAAAKLIGQTLPTNQHGHAARYTEDFLKAEGHNLNRGHGVDLPDLGIEVKNRETTAVSPQTVAGMTVDEIINTEYEDSLVYQKFQKQLRVYTTNGVVVSANVVDFDQWTVQTRMKEAYNHARRQLIANPHLERTKVKGQIGYFERTKDHNDLSFRMSSNNMTKLETMTNSTAGRLFELVE